MIVTNNNNDNNNNFPTSLKNKNKIYKKAWKQYTHTYIFPFSFFFLQD